MAFILAFIVVILGGYRIISKQSKRMAELRKQKELVQSMAHLNQAHQDLIQERERLLQGLPGEGERLWLLRRLQEQAKGFNIRLIAIGPLKTESLEYFHKVSRSVYIEAGYMEAVRFFRQLETVRGFIIEDLSMERNPQNPSLHRIHFTLTSMELRDEPTTSSNLPSGKSLMLTLPVKEDAQMKVSFLRDPLKIPVRKAPRPTKPIELSGFTFTGTIDLLDQQLAVIESADRAYVVKEGERIGDKEVIGIEKDRVLLTSDGQQYFIRLGSP